MVKFLTYYGEMLLAPVLGLVLLTGNLFPWDEVPGLVLGGIVSWTLAEYAVHRWVLHDLAPTQHRLHHARPNDPIEHIFWGIWLCFAVVYLLAGGAFTCGVLLAYAWYLYVHHCAHFRPGWLPYLLVKHHEGHHIYATRNFGVSTTLWDHVFGSKLR